MSGQVEDVRLSRFREMRGVTGKVRKGLLIALPVVGALYILNVHSYFGFVPWKEQYLGVFISLILTSVFLGAPPTKNASRDNIPWYDVLLAIAGFAVGMYIAIEYPEVVMTGRPVSPLNVGLGITAILLGMEAARRMMGWVFVILTSVFIFYGAFTNIFPGFLWGKATAWNELIVHLYLDTSSFLYFVGIAAVLVLAFILFGQVLFAFGGGKVLTDLALSLTGRYRGGPAKAAVVGSCLFGTISGSSISNIMVTGTVTIPLMKRIGYKPHFAAAIEAVASNGGAIMPPVMGIVAFIMADITGLLYRDIALAAIVPAILYYTAILIQVDLEAARSGIMGLSKAERPPLLPILKKSWLVILPLIFIIYTLFVMRIPPATAAIYSTIFCFLILPIVKENRTGFWRRFVKVFEDVGESLLSIGVLLICAGFIVAVVGVSGLGFRLSLALVHVGNNSVILLLLLAAASGIVMGMGLPASATYILLAVLIAPALTQLGMDLMASHLFILYFGNLALVTPPIALGAFVAAGLARANPMKTGWYAMRLAILSYIVPFMFIFSPALLMRGQPWEIVIEVTSATIATLSLGIVLAGYFYRAIPLPGRVVLGLGALALFASVPVPFMPLGLILKIAGLLIVIPAIWYEWKQKRPALRAAT